MAHEQTYECDVLVIGSGASGMATAVTAAKHGLKVLIVEKEPRFGRKIWGLLCLELWERRYHDEAGRFRELLSKETLT